MCPPQVNLVAVEQFIRVVGEKEDAIFQRRMRMLQRDKHRRERDRVPFCLYRACSHQLPETFQSIDCIPDMSTSSGLGGQMRLIRLAFSIMGCLFHGPARLQNLQPGADRSVGACRRWETGSTPGAAAAGAGFAARESGRPRHQAQSFWRRCSLQRALAALATAGPL